MAGDLTFTFDDAIAFAGKMAQAPAIVQREMTTTVDRLVLTGMGEAIKIVPVDTGHLRRSIAKGPTTWSGSGASGSYGTATTYAQYVEYGTWKMAAQPYMGPSMDVVQSKADAEFAAMLKYIFAAIGVG